MKIVIRREKLATSYESLKQANPHTCPDEVVNCDVTLFMISPYTFDFFPFLSLYFSLLLFWPTSSYFRINLIERSNNYFFVFLSYFITFLIFFPFNHILLYCKNIHDPHVSNVCFLIKFSVKMLENEFKFLLRCTY